MRGQRSCDEMLLVGGVETPQTERGEATGNVGCGRVVARRSGATPLEPIAREIPDVGVDGAGIGMTRCSGDRSRAARPSSGTRAPMQCNAGRDASQEHASRLSRPAAVERPDHLTPVRSNRAKLPPGSDNGYWDLEP